MKKLVFLIVFLFATAAPRASAQCAPLGGLANLQWFGNDGSLLQNGALYFFVAQSSTQAPTYSDSQCSQLNVNPLPFAQGSRTTVWVPAGNFKMVLCSSSTDGPACSPGDQLFVVDNLPGASSGGGGGGGPNFVGVFISQTASPATSGALRLSSGDSTCFRNQAGSANLCWTKSSGDILQWGGGSLQLPEIAAPTCGAAGTDCFWADNTAHRIKGTNNGGTSAQYVLSGNDIDTTDAVKDLHFGSSQIPTCSTAPTSNQFLQLVGTCIQGTTLPNFESTLTWGAVSYQVNSPACSEAIVNTAGCVEAFFANAHTLIRLTYTLSTSPTGCTTSPVVGLRDITAASNVSTLTVANGASTGFVDSGALSVAMTAGHKFGLWFITPAVGCTQVAQIGGLTAVFQ